MGELPVSTTLSEPIYNLVVSSTPPKEQELQHKVENEDESATTVENNVNTDGDGGRTFGVHPSSANVQASEAGVCGAQLDAQGHPALPRQNSFSSSSGQQRSAHQIPYPQAPPRTGSTGSFNMSALKQPFPQQGSINPSVPTTAFHMQQQQRFPPTPPVAGYPFPPQLAPQYTSSNAAAMASQNQAAAQAAQSLSAQYYVPSSGYSIYYDVYGQPYTSSQPQTALPIHAQHPGYVYPPPYPQTTASITPTTPHSPLPIAASFTQQAALPPQASSRWPYPHHPGHQQQQQYHSNAPYHLTNPFPTQQMQTSLSQHSTPPLTSPGSQPVPTPYVRRHSNPIRGNHGPKRRNTNEYADPMAAVHRWNQQTPKIVGPTASTYRIATKQQQFLKANETSTGQLQLSPSSRSSSLFAVGEELSNESSSSSSVSTGTANTSISTTTTKASPSPNSRPHDPSPPDPATLLSQSHNLPLLPRGPPRKPKQSGHALWVGNLPLETTVVELKDYFSNTFTNEIESVFLISKSNCAFVNYRTDKACNEAMARFHDSRFRGARLVCRLRRSSVNSPGPATTTGPASSTRQPSTKVPARGDVPSLEVQGPPSERANQEHTSPDDEIATSAPADHEAEPASLPAPCAADHHSSPHPNSRQYRYGPGAGLRDRVFIVKSLTVEDLDLSVKNGIWATQSHNEEMLNHAFETSENVYLVFSANKSGEYYGYARMSSKIQDTQDGAAAAAGGVPLQDGEESKEDPAAAADPITIISNTLLDLNLPKALVTPATAHAPKGKIIDDSARGTIFWERDDKNEEGSRADGDFEGHQPQQQHSDIEDIAVSSAPADWGKSFSVTWLSTVRIPFYRTRGLRNAWNSNREVKIARDGTEVETGVGRRLVTLFARGVQGGGATSEAVVGDERTEEGECASGEA